MARVSQLRCKESSDLDLVRIVAIYAELGHEGAERVIAATLEDLAHQVVGIETAMRQSDGAEAQARLSELIVLAEQVGFRSLMQVARALCNCVDVGDRIAMAAVASRLVRVAERSLTEIWTLGDPWI